MSRYLANAKNLLLDAGYIDKNLDDDEQAQDKSKGSNDGSSSKISGKKDVIKNNKKDDGKGDGKGSACKTCQSRRKQSTLDSKTIDPTTLQGVTPRVSISGDIYLKKKVPETIGQPPTPTKIQAKNCSPNPKISKPKIFYKVAATKRLSLPLNLKPINLKRVFKPKVSHHQQIK